MKKLLFYVCAVLAILGCDGDYGDLPCLSRECSANEVYVYCHYDNRCERMSDSDCSYYYRGTSYHNDSLCGISSSSSSFAPGSSGSGGLSSSGGEGENSQSYGYCILSEYEMCLEGPFTLSDCNSVGGIPSNNCPYGSVVPGSSGGGATSSSSVEAGNELSSPSVVPSSSSLAPSSSSIISGGKGNSISSYRTVKIGYQVWMAENLDYAVEGSKCYNNDPANCDKYGRLYDWATAMNLPSSCNENTCSGQVQYPHQGICPSGWHIPSNDDWDVLMNYVGGSSVAGKHLKAVSGWNSYSGIENLDTHGFSALPGGDGYSSLYSESFSDVGYGGNWWSTSEIERYSNLAYGRSMNYDNEYVFESSHGKTTLYSVRCLQDSDPVFTCNMTATAGKEGTAITPAPTVTCNGINVPTANLTWTPANLTPTAAGSVAVSVAVSGGICSGMAKACGSVNVAGPDGYGPALNYEGQTYKTVVIGTQTWMAENLNYNATSSKCYDNEQSNCDTYGRLYDWATALTVCPSGWHLPSEADWNTLSSYVQSNSGCSSCDARLLKATSGWNWDGNGTDQYGFSALPGGSGDDDGSFGGSVGIIGDWWSASEYEYYSYDAYSRYMNNYYENAHWYHNDKTSLLSVRCLQD